MAEHVRGQSFSDKLIRPINTSTSDGEERVTYGNTDKAGMAEDEEQVDGDELGEAFGPLRRRVCRQPTPAEIRKHRLTHLPFLEWSLESVAGTANDHPHRTRPAGVRELLAVPKVHWDWWVGLETRMTVAQVVRMKGADMEW